MEMQKLKQRYWALRERGHRFRQVWAARSFRDREETRIASNPVGTPGEHASAAARWLATAQDHGERGGFSKCYYPISGRWEKSYPETTGYILGSFLKYADASDDPRYRERARRAADWLLDIQLDCGGIQAGTIGRPDVVPTIFNTGQVVHGWLDAWAAWREESYADAAIRACRWLIEQQDDDGCWRKGGSPRVTRKSENVYNVRVAWAMVRAGQALQVAAFVEAAKKNLEWAAGCETKPGWMDKNDLWDCTQPISHTIAYAAEGFFEAGLLLDDERFIQLALRTCHAMAGAQRSDGHFPGRLDSHFCAAADWVCLTGDAQMLLLWRRVARVLNDHQFDEAASRLGLALRSKQAQLHPDKGVEGGLAGSYPISGDYQSYSYPNWAAKFLLDAMMASLSSA